MSATIITMEEFKTAAQQAELAARFVRRPVSVQVLWSESDAWAADQLLSFGEFEAQALAVAMAHAAGGYLKTKITVTFDDGKTYTARIDLAAGDELCFAHHCAAMLRHYETAEGREYYGSMGPDALALIEFVQGVDFGRAGQLIDEMEQTAALAVTLAKEQAAAQAAANEQAAKQAFNADIERLASAQEYAHLTRIGRAGAKEVAKNIRADLKKAWPAVKFSVRCERGGWSSSVRVSWTDGPTVAEVDALVNRYEGGRFNGMTDCYEHNASPFNEVFGYVDYLFTSRDRSPALDTLAKAVILQETGVAVTGDENQLIEGEFALTLMHRACYRIGITHTGYQLDGQPWTPASESEQPDMAPVTQLQPAPVDAAPADALQAASIEPKPTFRAHRVADGWTVSISQGDQLHRFEGLQAHSFAEACRVAWALLMQTTPPDDDPDGGQPLPVAPVAEPVNQIMQGAEAPTPTRAALLGDYQGRVEAKRERLEGRAGKAQDESAGRHAAVRSILSWIVPGQPILVGHHSEWRHRRDLARVDHHMGQAVALARKAEHLAQRAEAVGQGGIASDDPDALAQLQGKLAKREARQQAMKDANRAKRSTYQAWQLSNNGAEIRRLRQRIEQLRALHSAAPIEQAGQGWRMFEDDGRIQIHFDGKPAAALRQLCKGAGFVWSPSRCAWVRKVTARAVREARRLAGALPAED